MFHLRRVCLIQQESEHVNLAGDGEEFYTKGQRGLIESFKHRDEMIGFSALKDVSGCCFHGIIFFFLFSTALYFFS